MSNKALKAYRIGNTFNVIIQSEVENPFEATQILRRNGTEMALVASDQIDIQEVLDIFNTRTPQSPEAKMGRHDIVMFTGELVYRMMNPDTKMNVPTIVYEQVEIELDRHLAVCETDKGEDKNG